MPFVPWPAVTDDSEDIAFSFTQHEIDMIYFACLQHVGHPDAENYEMQDDGFEHLMSALRRISAYMETVYDGPEVVTGL